MHRGRAQVSGGASQNSHPGAAAGEDKIRFQMKSMWAAELNLSRLYQSQAESYVLLQFSGRSDSVVALLVVTHVSIRGSVSLCETGKIL